MYTMNYLTHGRAHLASPYVVAGTAVPDWLGVLDRRIRVRSARATPWLDADDERIAAVARGIIQHHADDRWFHETRAFAELNLSFAVRIRDVLPADEGFRPSFLGHILVELLLDDTLAADEPGLLDNYYRALEALDREVIERAVELVAGRPAARLGWLVQRFCEERFLYDYADDGKLLTRLNAVLRRVGLPQLPAEFCQVLPQARDDVRRRKSELLSGGAASVAPASAADRAADHVSPSPPTDPL